jgi:hypothetical protein
VLRRREPRARLVGAASECDRLVLLGDVLELRQGPMAAVLEAAEPVLREIGDALGPGREAVLVPGNHDHHLLSAWIERRAGSALGLDSEVDWREGEPLATVASWLAPADVRAQYPGVWLHDGLYATHGHYGDRHTTVPMFERLGAGVMARIVHEPRSGPRRAEDYESVLAPIYAWLHAIAQNGGPTFGESSHGASARAWRMLTGTGSRTLRERALSGAFPAVVAALNGVRLGPLRTDLSGSELRRAALRACGEVLWRLEVETEHVVFGHTHRAGPLPGDAADEWVTLRDTRLTNTGCWVHEPGFLGSAPRQSPYRAGFCVVVDDQRPPELRNLLDSVPPARA